ncbi:MULTISPECIES: twin-arginine translocase TatA/TatE family subunit [unclassified Lentimicrobium]|uniref:Sec-independent protein translocase subunit TatA/TatB n=1 Tax=unclassified Lentimicrobium TaxID=2677434 RepID=UPI0015543C57|nr:MULTISPECIES: twin-arginine translocase TatA/TatE family subunit [unclassified Lentimicrobium]NPD46883.1 hypothetical protein [Lentimicrobium sp. S6]NPD83841.1 hypothetical protein [Lentimicrobium sp. L6]
MMPSALLFLDFGGGEILIILLVILIVLGPKKIPEFAKKAGQVMRYIRNATDDIKREINKETGEIQKPFKSAYNSATAFSENAHKAMKSTLDDLNQEENQAKDTETNESDEKVTKKDTKSTEKQ